jgi:hypothetical protein
MSITYAHHQDPGFQMSKKTFAIMTQWTINFFAGQNMSLGVPRGGSGKEPTIAFLPSPWLCNGTTLMYQSMNI